MKFLNINATISVKPQFSGEVIKAGTPLDISGSEANSDAAVGIVASDTAVGAESIAIVTEGTIDLTELTASYGSALTDECIAALKGITFLYGGKAVVPSGGAGGGGRFIVTLTQDDTDPENPTITADKTYAQVLAAWEAGKTIYVYDRGAGHIPARVSNGVGGLTLYATAFYLEVTSASAADFMVQEYVINMAQDSATEIYYAEAASTFIATGSIPPFEE